MGVYLYVGMYLWIYEHIEDGDICSIGAGVTGDCELPNVYAGKKIQVFWKSSTYFYLLSHLSDPWSIERLSLQR